MIEGEREELRRGRAREPVVRVEDVAYVIFERPDLDRTERFLTDFGLVPVERGADVLFMRAAGAEPFCYLARRSGEARFVGYGMRAGSAEDLELLTGLPEALSGVEPVEGPGDGRRVRLRAPHGFEVHVVHGREPATVVPMRPPMPMNGADEKVRVNRAQRPPLAPAPVKRLGHVVVQTRRFSASVLWHLRTLGMIVSDYQELEDARETGPVVAFLRCDRGLEPADHHSVALGAGIGNAFEHAAFEVQDLDAVGMGGEYLKRRGWTRAWGIGRHVLGSQIFDYWRDPDGGMLEHFADGDLFDASAPTGRTAFGRNAQHQWGPDLPDDFIDVSMTPAKLVDLLRTLWESEDVSLRKLAAVKNALTRPKR